MQNTRQQYQDHIKELEQQIRLLASTVAWLIHQKFELGIPLYRQEKEWEALGLKLCRATMANWLLAVYRD